MIKIHVIIFQGVMQIFFNCSSLFFNQISPHTVERRLPRPDPYLTQIESETSFYARLKAYFFQNRPLFHALLELSHRGGALGLSAQEKKIIFDSLNSPYYFSLRTTLRKILFKLPHEERKSILNEMADRENGPLLRLLSLFTLEEIQAIYPFEDLDLVENLTFVRGQKTQMRSFPNSRLYQLKKNIHLIIDLLIAPIRFLGLGKEAASEWIAAQRLQICREFIGIPVILMAACTLLFSNRIHVLLATAVMTLTLIVGLMIYLRYLKPCPDEIYMCENLTKAAREGKLGSIFGREDILQTMITLLSTDRQSRVYPLLIGKSGVGKTELVKALAQRIVDGKVPDNLKNKEVFLIVTQSLLDPNAFDNILEKFLNSIGPNKENLILFFDEAHSLSASQKINKFKVLIDNIPGSLPYCIFATNQFDESLAKDSAFAGRLHKMDIAEARGEETITILRDRVARETSFEVNDDLLKVIFERSKENKTRSQPAAAISLLVLLLSSVKERLLKIPSARACEEKRIELANHCASYQRNFDKIDPKSWKQKKEEIQQGVIALEKHVADETALLKGLTRALERKEELKRDLLQLSDQFSFPEKQKEWRTKYSFLALIEENIRKFCRDLGISLEVTAEDLSLA